VLRASVRHAHFHPRRLHKWSVEIRKRKEYRFRRKYTAANSQSMEVAARLTNFSISLV
jgi:hypothetical protein